jgi:hypothetical protein
MATAPYRETLPASWFYDPEHYRREEQAIWQRDWVCVGRAEDWPQSGDFQRLRIGGQQIWSRGRGRRARLAQHLPASRFGARPIPAASSRGASSVYHAGPMRSAANCCARATRKGRPARRIPALPGSAESWRGFVFRQPGRGPGGFIRSVPRRQARRVAAWPLGSAACTRPAAGLQLEDLLGELPRVLPLPACTELVRLVPIRTGFMEYADAGLEPDPAQPSRMLRPGAVTSTDGGTELPWFAGLGTADTGALTLPCRRPCSRGAWTTCARCKLHWAGETELKLLARAPRRGGPPALDIEPHRVRQTRGQRGHELNQSASAAAGTAAACCWKSGLRLRLRTVGAGRSNGGR